MKKSLLILLLGLALFGCGKPAAEAPKEEHGHEEAGHVENEVKLSPETQKLAGIKTFVAESREVQDSIKIPGTVKSTTSGRAVVTPPIAGRIVSITVQLGDQVRQGQTLALMESPELAQSWSGIAEATKMRDSADSELKQTKAEVQLALAKLSASRTNLNRQKELVKAGAFSQAPVQQAQNELNEAQSELLSVQKELASHAEQLRRLENLFKDGIVSKSELEAAKLELQQDQIRLDRTKAKIENAKATYDRERNIASRGLLNAKELQTAEADVRSSQLELDKARLRVRSAESALSSANKTIANARTVYKSNVGTGGSSAGRVALVAPISGTVTHLEITNGQAVDRTQVLLEVENLQSVWVTANVPEQDSARIRKGSSVKVTVASLPGKSFEGIVQIVGSKVDPKTRSIPTQCLVSNAAGRLKPDMFATLRLGIGSSVRLQVVPMTAIVTEGRKSFVFVKSGDTFEKREVTLGSEAGDVIGIQSGVKAGEIVASEGAYVLSSQLQKAELKGEGH